ncbi:Asp-tRNA(Asn)/Glu-tRNA(Gln) amidotransferase subunit GatA [Fimbriimonas ginsengisoli]|uniref:Glutamyl-tRNA(Gln) amidotransferase subunit A n=1 Tax=Fimbriimonas ginsengisoli Gsoil 348 TaxID=661478 RepID=A0A068NQN0_FIMGI|nr:Asp-tRNA(Asn)/Glu-tRNA(Gln) amidotransferase subunit GatA [Fimbriimonas ginsengisoli]AIE85741.1 aspartyl/glutamyl-tRNA(Asn/Gln) amidotransferase subunit A [Fimbriimonas ginsengisoli Gsoil 348]
MAITHLSAAELGRRIASRELSCVEVATAFLDRIESQDAAYGAFLKVDRAGALESAERAQTLVDRGEGGALTGVPIALKDNMSTTGLETTCASKILKGYVPPFDATVVSRLREMGMPILGKTNLDEFAMGTSTENSAFQLTRNPWDTERSPGGSSGGSAAAVAAELAPLSLGSDTGGSIRQPAALCGVVGFKPTYGRCSRYGLIAFGSSLDQIGPFARNVEDCALIASAITGHDPMDGTSLEMAPISSEGIKNGSLKGLRVALPKEMFGEATHSEVAAAVHAAAEAMRQEGAIVEEVSIPTISLGVTTYYIIAPAEASSNLARFDGIRYGFRAEGTGHIGVVERTRAEGFGHEVKSRIMVGTYALSAGYYDAYYLRAQQVRTLMQQEFERTFRDFDVVLSPTSPIPAFRLGELKNDPMALKLLDFCTIPANLGGMPGISLNCGFAEGLPVGLQLMAPVMQDERLLQIAFSVESILPNATRRPPIP